MRDSAARKAKTGSGSGKEYRSMDGILHGSCSRTQEACETESSKAKEPVADNMESDGKDSEAKPTRQHDATKARGLFDGLEEEACDDRAQLEAQVLTARQREAVEAYQEERTISGVASKLGIRKDTASDLIRNARVRLGLTSNKQLDGVATAEDCDGASPKEQSNVTAARLLDLLRSQDFRCALSGVELTPKTAQLDHRIPISKGGKHDMTNVWFLHKEVNRAKNTATEQAFIAMCRRVIQWTEGRATYGKNPD